MNVVHSFVTVSGAVLILILAWRLLNWIWLKPRKAEKLLREQGLRGNSYRFLKGDKKEMARMDSEAKAKPINFTHDIVPRVLPFIHKIINTFGENSFIWAGPRPTVLILDPELVREVLSKSYTYQKIPWDTLSKLLAQGLATLETDKWSKHRRIINPAFNLDKIKLMIPAFELSCSEMLSKWEKIVPSEGSCELDVAPYLQAVTSDAISRTAFGSNYEEGRKIFEFQKELGILVIELSRSFYIPGTRFLPTKRNRKMKAIGREMQNCVLNIINKRLKAMQAGETGGNDLLGILLESNLKEIQQHGSKQHGMSLEDVIEECKLFYLVGQETTSTLLVWTLILLGKHLDWQDRAREEVLQIFGANKPDFDGLNQLKVMKMIFNEVLRLYPPGFMLSRMVHETTKLGNLTLPPKTQIFLPIIVLHQDEKFWGADAKEFNPERFSDGFRKATNDQHAYFPFSSGPRICIGQSFAMIEAKMTLALILQRFSFELSPSYAHAPHTVITVRPQYGAQLLVRKI